MHHLHFRYVSENPSVQTCARFLQLLDDIPPRIRENLLLPAFHSLNVYSRSLEGDDPQTNSAYVEFKRRFGRLGRIVPDQTPIVYGMVCFILSTTLHRTTQGIFRIIETHLKDAENSGSQEKIASLRQEEHQLRLSYRSFCEL